MQIKKNLFIKTAWIEEMIERHNITTETPTRELKEKYNEVVEKIYDYPINSDEFYDLLRYKNAISFYKKGKYVICLSEDVRQDIMTCYDETFDLTDHFKPLIIGTMAENKNFISMERYLVENDPRYMQLSVAALITDGESIIVLKTTEGSRIKNKVTLIQGHVDFSKECYLLSPMEHFRESIKREIREEILNSEEIVSRVDNAPNFGLYTKSSVISLEHFGLIYIVRVPSVDNIYNDLDSGEKNKHYIAKLSLSELGSRDNSDIDAWLKIVMREHWRHIKL
jgi:predicted NUDIX family phosphoesterase